MRQVIIARKDLQMSPGKLAAQVSHASMAFLTQMIREHAEPVMKYQTLPSYREEPNTSEKKLEPYKHGEQTKPSIQAFEEGEDILTYKPADSASLLPQFELCNNEIVAYESRITIDKNIYELWMNGIFTKTVCEARNRTHLLKAVGIADELGLKQDSDYFLIYDACLTELKPEEVDDDGTGRTLTCIGFRPLPDEIAHAISRKFHLYV